MKTDPMFLGDWTGNGASAVLHDFEAKPEDSDGHDILFAWYVYEDYSGSAFVLTRKGGQLYEVNGSHCSCYGLEGQWEPEETTIEALTHRLNEGEMGIDYSDRNAFAAELRDFLEIVPKPVKDAKP